MIGITQTQYEEALDAAHYLALAATSIMDAAKMLDALPARFRGRLEAIDGSGEVTMMLAAEISKLADRIGLDADNAAERTE